MGPKSGPRQGQTKSPRSDDGRTKKTTVTTMPARAPYHELLDSEPTPPAALGATLTIALDLQTAWKWLTGSDLDDERLALGQRRFLTRADSKGGMRRTVRLEDERRAIRETFGNDESDGLLALTGRLCIRKGRTHGGEEDRATRIEMVLASDEDDDAYTLRAEALDDGLPRVGTVLYRTPTGQAAFQVEVNEEAQETLDFIALCGVLET